MLHTARRALAALAVVLAVAPGPASAFSFTDAHGEAGLSWRHASSANQNYLEVTGGGLCWADVDGDGVEDLFLPNGKYSSAAEQADLDPRSALYLNEGDGTFVDASEAWGADLSMWAQGCAAADYDGDGDLDIAVVGYHQIALLRNDGNAFQEVAARAGLTLEDKCGEGAYCFATSASFADADLDGDLDLYVGNYVDWNIDDGGVPAPGLYNGQPDVYFRNLGDGTFADATAEAGLRDNPGPDHSKTFQISWADYDRDGDLDAYSNSDTTPNSLHRNAGNGTFTDVAPELRVDDARSSMGLVFQDLTGDGRPELYMTHYEGENNAFYEARAEPPLYLHRSGEAGLRDDIPFVGWGTGFFDLDHDGDKDIYVANGHTEEEFDDFQQRPLLFRHEANGTFTNVTHSAGPGFERALVGRGSAVADYDLDGDLDIAILGQFNETVALLRNDGAAGSWLQVELRQQGPNPRAIGAEVTITAEGLLPSHTVIQSGTSYLSQDTLIAHAGLGSATEATVRVRWPDGAVDVWTGVPVDARVRAERGAASLGRDTLSPRSAIVLEGPGGSAGWHRGAVEVAVTAEDRALGDPSGVARIEARTPGGPWRDAGFTFRFEQDGTHAVEARAVDHAGNREPARRFTVLVDGTPPATVATVDAVRGEDGWVAAPAVVRLAAGDATSGVGEVRVRVDGGAWASAAEVVLAASGERVVEYFAVDVAGNEEPVQRLVVLVDAEPPRARVEGWPLLAGAGGVRVEARAEDPSSGVRRVAFFLGDEASPRHVDDDGGDGWTWDLREAGAHAVRAVATDGVGHGAAAEVHAVVAPDPGLPGLPLPLGAALLMALATRRR